MIWIASLRSKVTEKGAQAPLACQELNFMILLICGGSRVNKFLIKKDKEKIKMYKKFLKTLIIFGLAIGNVVFNANIKASGPGGADSSEETRKAPPTRALSNEEVAHASRRTELVRMTNSTGGGGLPFYAPLQGPTGEGLSAAKERRENMQRGIGVLPQGAYPERGGEGKVVPDRSRDTK